MGDIKPSTIKQPDDEQQIEKLRRVIQLHYDLEIHYKRQELNYIISEIKRGHSILEEFKQLLVYDIMLQRDDASSPDVSIAYGDMPPLFQKIKLNSKKLEAKTQYETKSDGTIVKMVCPYCKKDKYGNILGVKNHLRIMHNITINTPEERISLCGVPVSLEEIPDHFFTENQRILHSEINLAQIRKSELEEKLQEGIASCFNLSAGMSESRFHIKKKIVIGNIAKKINKSDDFKDINGRYFTHKWKVYLHGPPEGFEVDTFIKKVVFFLDPSYAPNDIIEVTQFPFTISQYGWGQFTLKIQVYFYEGFPKEFYHTLSFKNAKYHVYSKAAETEHIIELEKYRKHIQENDASDSIGAIGRLKRDHLDEDLKTLLNLKYINQIDIQMSESFDAISKDPSSLNNKTLNSMISDVIVYYPLFLDSKLLKVLRDLMNKNFPSFPKISYEVAKNFKELSSWSLIKQKSVQWHRAKLIKTLLVNSSGLNKLSTKTVLLHMSVLDKHLVPDILPENGKVGEAIVNSTTAIHSSISALEPFSPPGNANLSRGTFCHFCGMLILPSFYASHLKRCPLKPIRMNLSSIFDRHSKDKTLPEYHLENTLHWLGRSYQQQSLGAKILNPYWIWKVLVPLALSRIDLHPISWCHNPSSLLVSYATELFLRDLLSISIYNVRAYAKSKLFDSTAAHAADTHPTDLKETDHIFPVKCLTKLHIYKSIVNTKNTPAYLDFLKPLTK